MDDLITVNIMVADRTYRLKTKPQDEEIIRKTARLINDKVKEFRAAFAGKDMQDYISMVLLWFAVDQTRPTENPFQEKEALATLQHLEAMLDNALSVE